MPYNNTPIAPPSEYTGQVSLPLARVKKIINADEDIASCSNNAAFVITVATEMFVQHLVKQVHNVVTTERGKQRRTIQYKDVSNAVARIDNLEFLSDVVPKTMTLRQAKAIITNENNSSAQSAATTDDRTGREAVNGHKTGPAGADEMDVDAEPEQSNRLSQQQLELQLRSPRANGVGGLPANSEPRTAP